MGWLLQSRTIFPLKKPSIQTCLFLSSSSYVSYFWYCSVPALLRYCGFARSHYPRKSSDLLSLDHWLTFKKTRWRERPLEHECLFCICVRCQAVQAPVGEKKIICCGTCNQWSYGSYLRWIVSEASHRKIITFIWLQKSFFTAYWWFFDFDRVRRIWAVSSFIQAPCHPSFIPWTCRSPRL